MNGIMNENQLTFVREYEFDKPLIQKIDSVIENNKRNQTVFILIISIYY